MPRRMVTRCPGAQPDADPHSDADPHPEADADSDADPHPEVDADAHSDAHPGRVVAQADADADTERELEGLAVPLAVLHADPHRRLRDADAREAASERRQGLLRAAPPVQ